ncbi:hypothetical protein FSP39_016836 [Pinctada imbricata]|uniref:Uncharacterized protein n=1 Tax=Pinctada imbricata TaxID=66713 RepID=A0AA88YVH1_PINIB|nr:hypothetical protein FSP39_016836 [Pinctada imbricata]
MIQAADAYSTREGTTWRDVWTMVLGSDPPYSHVTSPITAIFLIYFSAMMACYILYKLSEVLVPGFIKIYALDFFKTMAFITYGFGHGFVRKYYGNFGYFLCVVPVNTITVLLFTHGEGNVLGNWKAFLKGQRSFLQVLPRIFVQILSAAGAWRLGLFIYNLDFFWHLPETAATLATDCKSFLNIPFYLGFLLEMTGVTYDHWVGSQPMSSHRPLDIFLKFINTASVVCFGSHLTGMFMHPSMASAFSFGCGSTPIYQHIIVYWLGPFTGAFLSIKLSERFVLTSQKSKKVEPPKEKEKSSQNDSKKKNTKSANDDKISDTERKVRRRKTKN